MKYAGLIIAFALACIAIPARALTLQEALEVARQANPTIEAALHRIQASAAATDEALSAYYPTVTLSGAYNRTDNPGQAFFMNLNQRIASLENDFNQPDDTENLRLSAGVKWLLLDGGQRGLSRRMARLQEMASTDRMQAAQQELTYQVTRSYYGLQQARENKKTQEAMLHRVEESLRVARARFDAGSALKTDVLHLEVMEAEAQENLIRADHAVILAIEILNTTIGEDLVNAGTELVIRDDGALPPVPELIALDFNRRPELNAIRRDEEAGSLAARRANREGLPRLSAYGSADWDSDVSSDYEQSYFAGAVLEWDLFTGFRQSSRSGAAKAQSLEQAARRRELENQLQLELQQAYLSAKESQQRLVVVARALDSATEAYRITRARYEEGAADITELLTAQSGLTASEIRALNTRFDYLIAQAKLQRASGESETQP
jgi:outer membrane protein